ncbi:MAG: hypothetical protein C4536_00935 [Actinobacteria bacterium]|nr:MAG: hypothetical protein C4536_00935 [Actinomycetota bacterium]
MAIIVCIFTSVMVGYGIFRYIAHPQLKMIGTPDGYEQVVGRQFDEEAEAAKQEEPGLSLDAFYLDSSGYRQIFIAHTSSKIAYFYGLGENGGPPETRNLREMKRFVMDNRKDIEEAMQEMYAEFSIVGETPRIEAFQLERSGFCGIHFTHKIQREEDVFVQDRLLIFRDGIPYAATVQNQLGEVNDDEVEYLIENLYFE